LVGDAPLLPWTKAVGVGDGDEEVAELVSGITKWLAA
jgi:hypothetical protein